MQEVCPHCQAQLWRGELTTQGGVSLCCGRGQVSLPPLQEPPQPLADLLSGTTPAARSFLQNIRLYNSALQLASSGVDTSPMFGEGVQQFTIRGSLHHMGMGALAPPPGQHKQFAQLYICDGHEDSEAECRAREHLFGAPQQMQQQQQGGQQGEQQEGQQGGLQQATLLPLQNMLHHHNPYVQRFKSTMQLAREQGGLPEARLVLGASHNSRSDPRRYNTPTAAEVAGFFPGGEEEAVGSKQDIIVHMHGGGVQYLNDLNPAYTPLHFVLLFPRGEPGWHPAIRKHSPAHSQRGRGGRRGGRGGIGRGRGEQLAAAAAEAEAEDHAQRDSQADPEMGEVAAEGEQEESTSRNVTVRQWGAYRMQMRQAAPPPRPPASNHLLKGRRLFQEFLVDTYCIMEGGRLELIRHNQDQLRASLYSGVADAVNRGDTSLQQVGQRVVLPATFQGGPRHMQQRYQDSMAIIHRFGKPDLFVTFTMNPKCPEVRARGCNIQAIAL